MSQTQYDFDFEYDTGRSIPRDSAGWEEFHNSRKQTIIKWAQDAVYLNKDDAAFFNISYITQKRLQKIHPSLEEAWKHYLTLLQVTNE